MTLDERPAAAGGMTLDEMLETAGGGEVDVAAGWGQGRATYGGLVAGLLLARAEALVGDGARRLRSANVSFVGPVAPGAAALDGVVLRAGSSVTQVSVSLVQEGETRAVLLAGFGGERESALAVDAAPRNPRPSLPAPDEIEPLPHVPGLTPDFFAHVDLRIAAGGMPFSGAAEPDFGGYMRFRSAPAAFGDRELLTLADAWPPAIIPMLTGPASMSSLAWTFEPIPSPSPDAPADAPDAFWQYDVTTHHAAGGYARTTARIWDARGDLRALSHQTVAYFA